MLKKRTFRVDFRAYEYAKGYIEMTEDLVLPYRKKLLRYLFMHEKFCMGY